MQFSQCTFILQKYHRQSIMRLWIIRRHSSLLAFLCPLRSPATRTGKQNNTYMSIIPKRTSVRQSRISVFFKQTNLFGCSRVFDKIQTLRSEYQLIHNVIYKFIWQQNYFSTYSYTKCPNAIRKHNYQRLCFSFVLWSRNGSHVNLTLTTTGIIAYILNFLNYYVQFYSHIPVEPI